MQVGFQTTEGECVMAPSNYQAWGGCSIPPNPVANLASRPPLDQPTSHSPPGAGRGGSSWPPTPTTSSASQAAAAWIHSMSRRIAVGTTKAALGAERVGLAWRPGRMRGGPRDGRSLRDARGMWNVRDEQNLREGSLAGSFLAQCPGYVLKMLFGSLSVMDLCM